LRDHIWFEHGFGNFKKVLVKTNSSEPRADFLVSKPKSFHKLVLREEYRAIKEDYSIFKKIHFATLSVDTQHYQY
jgi:hypothetical protein